MNEDEIQRQLREWAADPFGEQVNGNAMSASAPSYEPRPPRMLLVASACLVAVLAMSLLWVSRSGKSSEIADEPSNASSETVDTTPRTLTSVPFCELTSTQLAEAGGEGPNPEEVSSDEMETFWAEQNDIGDAGRAVEDVFGLSPTWAGYHLDGSGLLVFRFTDRDPERDAQIAAIVDGRPYVVVQTEFSEAERNAAAERLRDALTAAGRGSIEEGAAAFGVAGWGSGGLTGFVEIDLSDHDRVETWSQRVGLDPPYDVYCINPQLIVSE